MVKSLIVIAILFVLTVFARYGIGLLRDYIESIEAQDEIDKEG